MTLQLANTPSLLTAGSAPSHLPSAATPLQVKTRLDQLARKLALPAYAEKTPDAIKVDDQERMSKAAAEQAQVEAAMEDMRKMLLADS